VGQGVAAWVVLRAGAAATAEELIDFLPRPPRRLQKPVEVHFVPEPAA